METINKILSWLKTFPVWVRALIVFFIGCLFVLFTLTSCGTPKTVATVQNVNPNSTVTVTMSVSNSTTSEVETNSTPSVSYNPLQ